MAKRTASEMLQQIEAKMDRLFAYVANSDQNLKLIVGRLNELMDELAAPVGAPGEGLPEGQAPNPESAHLPGPTDGFLGTDAIRRLEEIAKHEKEAGRGLRGPPRESADMGTPMHAQEVGFEPQDFDAEGHPVLQEVAVAKGERRGGRGGHDGPEKVVVSQVINYPSGEPVFLAEVHLTDEGGGLLKKTRTNPQGRWIAPLGPGRYWVSVSKQGGTDRQRPAFDVRYAVDVRPESDKPMELPSPDLSTVLQ